MKENGFEDFVKAWREDPAWCVRVEADPNAPLPDAALGRVAGGTGQWYSYRNADGSVSYYYGASYTGSGTTRL